MIDGFLESVASANDAGWSGATGAYADGGGYASTQTDTATCKYSGFDFSGLPSGVTITGIRVRTDGWWHDTTGGSILDKGRILIELSWDGGTSWTSNKAGSVLLEDAEETSYYGGPQDTWGHTWTRSQVDSSTNFVVRITANSSSYLDTPEWRVDFIHVAVYYTDTSIITVKVYDSLGFSDTYIDTSLKNVAVRDFLNFYDSGSAGQDVAAPKTNQVSFSGDAIAALGSASHADFSAAATPSRSESFYVGITCGTSGSTVFIGDANAANAVPGTDPGFMGYAQEGLIAISYQTVANFGEAMRYPSCRDNVANIAYNDGGGNMKTLSELFGGSSGYSGTLYVWCAAKSNTDSTWYQQQIFMGKIGDMRFTEQEAEFDAYAINHGDLAVPDQVIDSGTFDYNDDGGTDGNMIEDTQGKVIPIGIGRFDYTAVNQFLESGHPFFHESSKNPRAKSQAAIMAGQMGLKYPMMPIIPAIWGWGPVEIQPAFPSVAKNVIFLYGSRKAAGKIYVALHDVTTDPANWEFGLLRAYAISQWTHSTNGNIAKQQNILDYTNICSWVKGDGFESAAFFVKDRSHKSIGQSNPLYALSWGPYYFNSAGHLGGWENYNGAWTTGDAMNAYGVFVNTSWDIRDQALSTRLKYFSGALQACGVPFQSSRTVLGTRTGFYLFDDVNVGDIDNPEYAIDLKAPLNGAVFTCDTADTNEFWTDQSDYEIYRCQKVYKLPTKLPGLGELYGVMLCLLYNYDRSTDPKIKIRYAGPSFGTVSPGIASHGYPKDFAEYGALGNIGSSLGRELATFGNNNTYMNSWDTNSGLSLVYNARGSYWMPATTAPYRTRFDLWLIPKYIYRNKYDGEDPDQFNATPFFNDQGSVSEWPSTHPEERGEMWEGPSSTVDENNNYRTYTFTTTENEPFKVGMPVPHMASESELMVWGHSYDILGPAIKFPMDMAVSCASDTVSQSFKMYGMYVVYVFRSPIQNDRPIDVWSEAVRDEQREKEAAKVYNAYPGDFGRLSPWVKVVQEYRSNETYEAPRVGGYFVTGRSYNTAYQDGTNPLGNPLAEKPLDIARTLIQHYCGTTTFNDVQYTTGLFGSFEDCESSLPTIGGGNFCRMTFIEDRQSKMSECLGKIAEQFGLIICEQLVTESGITTYKYQAFHETDDPATDCSSRMYGGGTHYFVPDDLVSQQIEVTLSPLTETSNNIDVKYGLHRPSGDYSGRIYLSRGGSNLKSEQSTYQAAAALSFAQNGIENPRKYIFEDIWDPNVAEKMTKHLFSRLWTRRVAVSFRVGIKYVDVQIGHVIRFDNSMSDVADYPGQEGTSNWADHQFNVLGVNVVYDSGLPCEVEILAKETFTWAHA